MPKKEWWLSDSENLFLLLKRLGTVEKKPASDNPKMLSYIVDSSHLIRPDTPTPTLPSTPVVPVAPVACALLNESASDSSAQLAAGQTDAPKPDTEIVHSETPAPAQAPADQSSEVPTESAPAAPKPEPAAPDAVPATEALQQPTAVPAEPAPVAPDTVSEAVPQVNVVEATPVQTPASASETQEPPAFRTSSPDGQPCSPGCP